MKSSFGKKKNHIYSDYIFLISKLLDDLKHLTKSKNSRGQILRGTTQRNDETLCACDRFELSKMSCCCQVWSEMLKIYFFRKVLFWVPTRAHKHVFRFSCSLEGWEWKTETSERCNLEMSLNPLGSWAPTLQRCSIKKACVFVSVSRFLFLPRSSTQRERLLAIDSKSHTSQSTAFCSSHFPHSLLSFFFFFFLLLRFWWHFPRARSLPWDIVHVPTPLQPHGRTHMRHAQKQTHTVRLESGPSEKLEPSAEQRLRRILCSACQCCSFDLQPADDRSTLGS